MLGATTTSFSLCSSLLIPLALRDLSFCLLRTNMHALLGLHRTHLLVPNFVCANNPLLQLVRSDHGVLVELELRVLRSALDDLLNRYHGTASVDVLLALGDVEPGDVGVFFVDPLLALPLRDRVYGWAFANFLEVELVIFASDVATHGTAVAMVKGRGDTFHLQNLDRHFVRVARALIRAVEYSLVRSGEVRT
jgi:hypothetical protein